MTDPSDRNLKSGDEAVAAAHAHERGYADYMRAGLTARNPYDPGVEAFNCDRWEDGFAKAKREFSL